MEGQISAPGVEHLLATPQPEPPSWTGPRSPAGHSAEPARSAAHKGECRAGLHKVPACCQRAKGGDPAPLLRSKEAAAGALGPAIGSPAQGTLALDHLAHPQPWHVLTDPVSTAQGLLGLVLSLEGSGACCEEPQRGASLPRRCDIPS